MILYEKRWLTKMTQDERLMIGVFYIVNHLSLQTETLILVLKRSFATQRSRTMIFLPKTSEKTPLN